MAWNSATCPPVAPGPDRRRVPGVRGEVADRVVAPVVGEPAVAEERLRHVVVHREQLDRGDTEVEQVGDGRLVGQPGVGAAQLGWNVGVRRGEALDVHFVDDGVRVPVARARVIGGPPVVVGRHHAARNVRRGVQITRGVGVAGHVTENLLAEAHLTADRAGVRVEQELGRVEAQTRGGLERARGAVAVRLPGTHPRNERVPDPGVPVEHRDAGLPAPVPGAALLEQAQAACRRRPRTLRRSSFPRRGSSRPAGTRCRAVRRHPLTPARPRAAPPAVPHPPTAPPRAGGGSDRPRSRSSRSGARRQGPRHRRRGSTR